MKKIIVGIVFGLLLLCACREKSEEQGIESMEVGPFSQKFQRTITKGIGANTLLSNDVRDILAKENGEVFAATANGVCSTFDGGGWWHSYVDGAGDNSIIALTLDSEGRLWAGVAGSIKRLDGEAWTAYSFTLTSLEGNLTSILGSSSGGIWVGTDKGVALFNGAAFEDIISDGISTTSLAEKKDGTLLRGTLSGLYSVEDGVQGDVISEAGSPVMALAVDEADRIYAGTRTGINVFDPEDNTWAEMVTGTTGLPFTDITDISFTPQKELLIGTTWGAAYSVPTERWLYFAGKHWVPDNKIIAAVMDPDGTLWLGTGQGIGKVFWVPMTLEEKAKHYEEITRARHNRMGMVESVYLPNAGSLSKFVQHDADNDGLWTQMYIAAESFRYAVTKDPEAKKNAMESFKAMLRLEQYPREMGNPGFHARSFCSIEEVKVWNPACAVYTTPEEICACKGRWWMESTGSWKGWFRDISGLYCWKNDTSSDEITGHMFGYSVYYDLVAESEEEKNQVREVVSRLMNHIVDNGYRLLDTNGMPTTFGHWEPEHVMKDEIRFNYEGTWLNAGQYWMDGLEIISYLRGAYHITGEKKFYDHYRILIDEYGYDVRAANWQNIFIAAPVLYNYSDDELASLAYYPLLQYERGDVLGKLFVDSVERFRKTKDPQRCPLWNFIAGSRMERGYGVEGAVRTLKEYPWSLIEWSMFNSHRTDVVIASTRDRHNRSYPVYQSTEVLPYDERKIEKWNSNPYELDSCYPPLSCGSGGHSEESGTIWLLPYWMGRYHGFIKE